MHANADPVFDNIAPFTPGLGLVIELMISAALPK